MIDWDVVHAVLQFPSTIAQVMVGVVILMRWHAMSTRTVSTDPVITFLLGLFILTLGLKQAYWLIRGSARAADLFEIAAYMDGHWGPTAFNALIAFLGFALFGRIGSALYGPRAYLFAGSSAAVILGVGIKIATWG